MKQINMVKLKIYKYIIWQKYREKEALISHFYLWEILSLKIGKVLNFVSQNLSRVAIRSQLFFKQYDKRDGREKTAGKS